jgi:hypothetical protein
MDSNRFDTLARTIANHPSRRDLLRALVGATVAGVLALGKDGAEAAVSIRERAPRRLTSPRQCHGRANVPCGDGCCEATSVCIDEGCAPAGAANCGDGYCPAGSTCSSGTCYPESILWGCSAESACESQCPHSINPFCFCGTTVEGDAICYRDDHGCDRAEFFCTSSRACPRGSVCVDLTDGCGGCASAVCNPVCTG